MSRPYNIASLATVKDALKAAAQPAAAGFSLLGISVDRGREGFESAMLIVSTGLATGTPSAVSITARLQDSADGTTFADVPVSESPLNPAVQLVVGAVSSRGYLPVVLTPLRRFIRVVFTVAFTGGTSPTILMDAKWLLGGQVGDPPIHA
jgi:hypothetical protein